jgi:DnaJ family protein C protein 7
VTTTSLVFKIYLLNGIFIKELANDLLRADSMCADAIYVRGLCLYYEDHVDKAFSHFQQVLRLAPDHQKAKDIYKRAKLLKQKKEEGNTLFKASNWSGAYDCYTEALNIDPCNKFTNAKLYYNRAIVSAKVNN